MPQSSDPASNLPSAGEAQLLADCYALLLANIRQNRARRLAQSAPKLVASEPASQGTDLRTVRVAADEALMAQIQKEAGTVDVAEDVNQAVGETARVLVGETLGRFLGRAVLPSAHRELETQASASPEFAPRMPVSEGVNMPVKRGRNARKAEIGSQK